MTAFASCQTPSRYGSWGLLEYQSQPLSEAHKMRAWVDAQALRGDFNEDGVIDFFDISAFLVLFSNGNEGADLNSDGLIDFFDISAFLIHFGQQCMNN